MSDNFYVFSRNVVNGFITISISWLPQLLVSALSGDKDSKVIIDSLTEFFGMIDLQDKELYQVCVKACEEFDIKLMAPKKENEKQCVNYNHLEKLKALKLVETIISVYAFRLGTLSDFEISKIQDISYDCHCLTNYLNNEITSMR